MKKNTIAIAIALILLGIFGLLLFSFQDVADRCRNILSPEAAQHTAITVDQ